jgi:hypothetical protein
MDKIKLTQRQVERQVKKIKGIIFENYKESEDGSYEGTISEEVMKIIQSVIMVETEITELQFLQMITEGTKELVSLLNEKVKGVDERVINFFAFDFMTQSIDFMYQIEIAEIDDDYDPMFI